MKILMWLFNWKLLISNYLKKFKKKQNCEKENLNRWMNFFFPFFAKDLLIVTLIRRKINNLNITNKIVS